MNCTRCFVVLIWSIAAIFYACNSNNEEQWENPLNRNEITMLQNAVAKIDSEQTRVYYSKIKTLSKETLPYSTEDGVRNLESYKDIYNWIKNEIKNFPLLFQYIIYEEKVVGEEYSNTILLLWDLSEELYPSVTEDMRKNNNTDPVYLIKKLLIL
jgi:hypothetical protein